MSDSNGVDIECPNCENGGAVFTSDPSGLVEYYECVLCGWTREKSVVDNAY